MEIRYRTSFIRDLKKLKKKPLYDKIHLVAFQALPQAAGLAEVPGIKALAGATNRYRIRVGNYRIGVRLDGSVLELVRVLDQREFYRYFP